MILPGNCMPVYSTMCMTIPAMYRKSVNRELKNKRHFVNTDVQSLKWIESLQIANDGVIRSCWKSTTTKFINSPISELTLPLSVVPTKMFCIKTAPVHGQKHFKPICEFVRSYKKLIIYTVKSWNVSYSPAQLTSYLVSLFRTNYFWQPITLLFASRD